MLGMGRFRFCIKFSMKAFTAVGRTVDSTCILISHTREYTVCV